MIFFIGENALISGDGRDVLGYNSFHYITAKYVDFTKRIDKYIRLERKNGHLYILDQHAVAGEFYRVNKTKYYCESFINDEALLSHSENPLKVIVHVGEIELA